MTFVRVNRLLLKALLERAVKVPELRDLAETLNRHCVFDEGCAALEHRDAVMYKRLLDE